MAGVGSREQANQYLEQKFLPWWNRTLTVEPANADNAHRRLGQRYDLGAILSHVETRQVNNDYTIQFESHRYRIEAKSVCTGLRGAAVRVEKRLDGSVAVRFGKRYLEMGVCATPAKAAAAPKPTAARRSPNGPNAGGKSQWMKGFSIHGGPTLEEAIEISNATR